VTQKKQILAEGKRKIEEKYEFLFNLQNLTLQKQQKMIQEVKENFLVRKSQLRSEKDLWIDKILRDCNDEIGIYQNLCRVINECRAKINEMLEISAGTAEEIIIFESECNQIEETLKWIEAGSL
jgi:ATP-dependent protease Clp ATPase subunit